jgi:hypothetical protein
MDFQFSSLGHQQHPHLNLKFFGIAIVRTEQSGAARILRQGPASL